MDIRRVLPVLGLFVVLLGSSVAVPQQAYATTITINDQASCEVIPGGFFTPGFCFLTSDFTVSSTEILVIENIAVLVDNSVFRNFGTVELNGGSNPASGALVTFGRDGAEIVNECGGIINANGGAGFQSAIMGVNLGTTLTNKGVINLFGGTGDSSGTLAVNGVTNNHGVVNENPGTGLDSGSILVIVGSYNDNLPSLCSISIEIDINPGSDLNCFNSDGHGIIPVAILGSETFDVTEVDPTTVTLDNQTVKTKGNGDAQASIEDVNDDGFDDLVIKIMDADGTYAEGEGTATLTGELFDGTPIEGSDSICITQ